IIYKTLLLHLLNLTPKKSPLEEAPTGILSAKNRTHGDRNKVLQFLAFDFNFRRSILSEMTTCCSNTICIFGELVSIKLFVTSSLQLLQIHSLFR
uniref:Uncharacterized protein n=1 Tax=Ciona intestinalis TaxID=7719 RepID=H2XVP9_CIOIN